MGQPLKCVLLLSLKEMAVRRLVAILWNDSDILASVMKGQNWLQSSEEEMKTIVNKIKDKIMKLELPELLMKQMVNVVRPIGFEIKRWADFHEKVFKISCVKMFEQDSAKFCFSTTGAVDYRRMAQEIVRCHKINVVERYLIACSYWLEDYIHLLWVELSEKDREHFSNKNWISKGLEFSWPHIFKDGQSNMDFFLKISGRNLTSFNQWAFEHSAKKGYKATAEYFFQKLSHEERKASLMRSCAAVLEIHDVPNHVQGRLQNVLLYLLSLMTSDQQTQIVRAYPVQVMSCFCDFPRQNLSSGNVDFIWQFLFPSHYRNLMLTLFNYDASHFPEFFKQSPPDFKKYVVLPDPLCLYFSIRFLTLFFDFEDSECIELMFRSADAAARVRLLCNNNVLRCLHDSMARGRWRLVEVCLREATLSRGDKKNLKNMFLKHLNGGAFMPDRFGLRRDVPHMNVRDPKLKRFFDFLEKA